MCDYANRIILYLEPANARRILVAGLRSNYRQARRHLHNPLIAAGWLYHKAMSGEYSREIKQGDGGDTQRIEHLVRGVRLASS